jgi:predicted ATPase
LYALLTGAPPFNADDPLGFVHAHIALEPPPLAALAPRVPPAVAEIITKLMAKSADDRCESARGLAKDLEECIRQRAATGAIVSFPLAIGDVSSRFEVPQTLYGRTSEIATLLAAFDRVAKGASELLLVGCYSGIGKSVLVNEVHKPVVARRGYFISGKYDQYNRNVPYSAISAAFRELVHYVLMEPPERVAQLRSELLAAVGANGRVLVDVVPALELLIGPQEPAAVVPPAEAKSRFDATFRAFVDVFARREHPLVLFLDDLQWADTPSLHLLETLLADSLARCLFVIAAYRDNEVDAAHPAMLMADNVEKTTSVFRIALGPIALSDTEALVADALRVGRADATSLTELVHARTDGNPFFLVQLLQSLDVEGHLTLDQARGVWTWDMAQIRAGGLTNDVIELMSSRLRKMPDATCDVLKIAACMGNKFDLHVLATVMGRTLDEIEQLLWPALSEELVLPLAGGYRTETRERHTRYRFLHDRVQQAAYAMLSDEQRKVERRSVGALSRSPPKISSMRKFATSSPTSTWVSISSRRPTRKPASFA